MIELLTLLAVMLLLTFSRGQRNLTQTQCRNKKTRDSLSIMRELRSYCSLPLI